MTGDDVVRILQPSNLRMLLDSMFLRFMDFAPRLLVALIAFYIFMRILRFAINRVEKEVREHSNREQIMTREREKRITTLFSIIRRVVFMVVWGVEALIILALMGINIGPVLAAAGVLGLAISFGSQSLVKDIISGTFILFENQIRVGDVAIINGEGGLVEQINLRTVVLRNNAGIVHIFPNGSINTISNMTKDWSAMVFDIGVAYKEDVDHVISVMKRVAAQMREEEPYKTSIIADMEVFGLDKFADSALIIKGRIKTRPIDQWVVGREYNKRLKKAFDEENIEIPFPHRTLYFGEASPAIELLMRSNHVRGEDDRKLSRITKQDREIAFIEERQRNIEAEQARPAAPPQGDAPRS